MVFCVSTEVTLHNSPSSVMFFTVDDLWGVSDIELDVCSG